MSRWNAELLLRVILALAPLTAGPSLAQPLEPLLGLDAYMAIPPGNPLTAKRVDLGKRLFFDKRLSADGAVSCALCHDPDRAFTDSKPVAVGAFGRKGTRRVPKLVNRGFGTSFFWDGGSPTLEEQVFKPILNTLEMALSEDEAVERVREDPSYVRAFQSEFGSLPDRQSISLALASYVRTIRSGDSPYDRFQAGNRDALTSRQLRGLQLFRTKANCVVCHLGPNFSDEDFHNTGVGWKEGTIEDRGRFRVTGRAGDTGKFKTPTLRNVSRSAPYMHDGSLATLDAVIDFYDEGGIANPYLDQEIVSLALSAAEKLDLKAFLESLNGRVADGLGPPATR